MCECCVFVVVGSFFSIQLCVAISCAEQLTLSQDIILKLIFLFVCRPFFTFFCLQCIWFSLNRPLKQLVYCSAWEITNPPLFISLILFIQPIYVPFLSLAITRSGGSYLVTHWTLKKEPTSIDSVVIFNYHFFASIFIHVWLLPICVCVHVTWSIDFYSSNKFYVDGFRWKLSPPLWTDKHLCVHTSMDQPSSNTESLFSLCSTR